MRPHLEGHAMTRYLTRVHTFWCDEPGCNWSAEEDGPAREAWANIRILGWRTRGGKHFCPKHANPNRERA